MGVSPDLDPQTVADALGDRPVRSYPALLSTEATAMAWARAGAPSGAVVVADYQASPRGRGGLPWTVRAGHGLGFTLLVRPGLPPQREGWPYVAAALAVDDVLGVADGGLRWPDAVVGTAGTELACLGVHAELGPAGTDWTSVTVLAPGADPPRAPLLHRLAGAIEERLKASPERVRADYLARCSTVGGRWRARLIPMGPGGPEVSGTAVDVLTDGALVLLTQQGSRLAVPPHDLGLLEDPAGPAAPPRQLFGRPVS